MMGLDFSSIFGQIDFLYMVYIDAFVEKMEFKNLTSEGGWKL